MALPCVLDTSTIVASKDATTRKMKLDLRRRTNSGASGIHVAGDGAYIQGTSAFGSIVSADPFVYTGLTSAGQLAAVQRSGAYVSFGRAEGDALIIPAQPNNSGATGLVAGSGLSITNPFNRPATLVVDSGYGLRYGIYRPTPSNSETIALTGGGTVSAMRGYAFQPRFELTVNGVVAAREAVDLGGVKVMRTTPVAETEQSIYHHSGHLIHVAPIAAGATAVLNVISYAYLNGDPGYPNSWYAINMTAGSGHGLYGDIRAAILPIQLS